MKTIEQISDKIHPSLTKSASPFVAMHPGHRILIAGVIGFLVLLLGIHTIFNHHTIPSLGWVYLTLQINLLLLLVPIIWYKNSYGWLHPLIFNIFISLIFHLRRFSLYLKGIDWHPAVPGWSDHSLTFLVAYELLLSAAGLVVYYFAFFWSPRLAIPRVNFVQPRNLVKKVLLTVMLSVLFFVAYMQTRGGVIAHILSWGQGRTVAFEGQYYWQVPIQFGLIACFIWLSMGQKVYRQPLFWICTATMLVIQFLTTGGRGGIVYALIYILLVFMIREHKIALTKILIALIVGFFVLGVLGEFRNSTFKGEIDWSTLTVNSAIESTFDKGLGEVSERSWKSFGSLPILARVPTEVDFLYGSSYLALLTLPIPRAFWSEKPGLVGGRVTSTFFGGSYGIPPGAIGENYWNFGILGVLGAFFVFGSFHRWLAETFRCHSHKPAAGVLYALILYNAAPTSAAILSCLILILPALMLLRVMGAITKAEGRRQRQ